MKKSTHRSEIARNTGAKLLQWIGGLTLVTGIALFLLLASAGYWMHVDEEVNNTDFILPLAGDAQRMIKAIELYKKGIAPTILVSNAWKEPPSQLQKIEWEMGYPNYSDTEFLKKLLELMGAGKAHLEIFGNGHVSTVEEAEALKKHLDGKSVSLLIVTSPSHALRAKMVYKKTLPKCRITITTTNEGAFDTAWWRHQKDAQNLLLELLKTVHYLVGGVFRSTDPIH